MWLFNVVFQRGYVPMQGHTGVIAELLKADAHLNTTNNCNETAVMKAAKRHNLEALRLLLKEGANVALPSGEPDLLKYVKNYKHHDCADIIADQTDK